MRYSSMRQQVQAEYNVKVGDTIRIDSMDDCGYDTEARKYSGRVGVVEYIDDMGYLHGDWGSLAVIPDADKFTVLS